MTQPWYVEFFGENYLRQYRPFLTPERTEREVLGIIDRLGLSPGACILDLACGSGRHSIPLAALGYQVTGLDLSPVLLDVARAAARDVGARVRWVHSDMRSIPFEAEFDAVINIFTAFGYLETQQEDQKVLDQACRALIPGGLFLMDTVNREALLRRFLPADVTRHDDGLLVLQEQEFDLVSSRLNARVTLFEPDGSRKEYRQSLRFYTLTELSDMCEAAGMRLEGYYGGLDGSELTLDSRRLIVVARKPKGT